MKKLLIIITLLTSFHSIANYTAQDFFKDGQFEEVYLSPNGTYLAAIVDRENGSGVAIINTKDKNLFNFIKGKEDDVFISLEWLTDERLEVSLGHKYGSIAIPIRKGYIVTNIDGSRQNKGTQGNILDRLPNNPEYMLTYFYDKGKPVIYKAFKKNSDIKQIERIPFRGRILADSKSVVRLAYNVEPISNDGEIYYRQSEKSEWKKIHTFKDKEANLSFLTFNSDDSKLYVYDGRANSKGYYLYDPSTDEYELLYKHDNKFNVRTVYDGRFNKSLPIGVEQQPGRYELTFFDSENPYSKLISSLQPSFPNERIVVQEMTTDGTKSLILVEGDKNPGDYYLFDVRKKSLEYLLSKRPGLKANLLANVLPIQFKAKDGLDIHGYLTKPNTIKPDAIPPLVVMVHGGPYGIRDNWEYNPEVQFLASKGYSVLQINYRGSGGYGLNFQYDAYRKMGQEMQSDITDGTLWAIEQGIADKRKICIYGASYGAYSAMMGLIQEPELYQCGIGYAGVYDISLQRKGQYKTSEQLRKFYDEAWNIKDKDFVYKYSPINHVEKITKPVFLAHGGKDFVTRDEHYRDMLDALQDTNKDVTTLYKKKEGHGFYKVKNKIEFYNKLALFLKENIGS
ncbi:S9 family peptidase [Kangiella sp. HZ709]|uniref:alpha/beta hydrolase family protein n=1 Tax=Kangiella sp. HZ709 TaxID=2666328 RepID=UPI0012B04308|nr:alpha/beta fold hydrolase [Kangiella sp. HZ709]MRX27725.1 prolyl oligopeptidase family serine peptidase [Kangiella sp. HZ709]